jgi:clan AA aspartic protease (TIGR02281 family)
VSADDWQLAIARWQEAIALLRKVPSSSSFYGLAKPKIAEYQSNLSIAKQRATLRRSSSPSGSAIATSLPQPVAQPISPSSTETDSPPAPTTQSKTNTSKTNTSNSGVFKVPITRRAGRTPVIEVTFNGGQVFEMIVDTGASGTVITQEMAQSLGVVPEGEVTADTASGKGVKFATGRVRSIGVPGIVAKNVRVAIGGDALELGLLGQDFFANYDVWIRQNVIEFHRR